MPLILAIESDRHQASQLTAMVRGRLRSELVLSDSVERALAALGDRVPDLILTSALLSSRDEATLAEWLRELDARAAHVQTLTIPVLDTPMPRSAQGRGGVLFALLGDRVPSPAAPDGCDPAVFAEQCKAYLERAAHDREPPHHVDEPADPHVDDEREQAGPEATVEAAPPPQPPPPPSEAPAEEALEIDLSAMLDETVVRQLNEAIEKVTRDAVRPAASSAESWPPLSGGRTAWPPLKPATVETRRPPSLGPATPQPKRFPERKPIQDEWGFFDPAQCGFAALIAKLDEITHVASPLPAPDPSAGPPDVSH